MGMWYDREEVTLSGTFKGSVIIAAVEVVTTEAQRGYHLQQRPDGNFDVGQLGRQWEQFRVGGPTGSIYDEPFIGPEADYDTLVVDNDPWFEGGLEGGTPRGDEQRLFVKALVAQLHKQRGSGSD